jgi:hypothetical protein
MGNGHEPVQGWSANDGIEWQVNLRDVELNVLRAEVLLGPECNRECDAPKGIHRLSAHSAEWTKGSQTGPGIRSFLNAAWLMTLRPAPLSISTWCSRMLAMTGAVMSGSIPAPAMLSGQSDAPTEMVVLLHRWCGVAFGTPGVADRTSRRRDLTFLQEVSSQLPTYMTYNFLRWSLSPPESKSPMKTSFRTPLGD